VKIYIYYIDDIPTHVLYIVTMQYYSVIFIVI